MMDVCSPRRRPIVFCVSAAVALVVAFAGLPDASAQTTSSAGAAGAGTLPGKMRLKIFGTLGFGGEASGEVEFVEEDGDVDEDDFDDVDMDTTNGFGVEFDYALHRYFLLGGRLGLNFIDYDALFDDDDDRSIAFNIDVVPIGRLPLAGAPIEFYLAAPIGPTMFFPNDDFEDDIPGDTDLDPGVSWNLSLHAGINYWFNPTIGVFVEQGWYHQAFSFHGDTDVGPQTLDLTTRGSFNQYSVQLGLSIGL